MTTEIIVEDQNQEIKIEITNPLDLLPFEEREAFKDNLKQIKANKLATAGLYSRHIDECVRKGEIEQAQASIVEFKKYKAFLMMETYKRANGHHQAFSLGELFRAMQ
jgi:hypothetical protein